MSKPARIRRAGAGDVKSICDLLFGLKSMYGSCEETTASLFHDRYAASVGVALMSPQNAIWVAETPRGEIAGFLSTTRRLVLRLGGEVGVLEEVFVRPAYRRRGLAYELWQSAIAELRGSGIRTVEVVTSLAHPGQRQFAKRIGIEWYSSIHRVAI